MKENQRRYLNRVIVLLLFSTFVGAWVMVNTGELLTSALLYMVLSVVGVLLILNWDKIGKK